MKLLSPKKKKSCRDFSALPSVFLLISLAQHDVCRWSCSSSVIWRRDCLIPPGWEMHTLFCIHLPQALPSTHPLWHTQTRGNKWTKLTLCFKWMLHWGTAVIANHGNTQHASMLLLKEHHELPPLIHTLSQAPQYRKIGHFYWIHSCMFFYYASSTQHLVASFRAADVISWCMWLSILYTNGKQQIKGAYVSVCLFECAHIMELLCVMSLVSFPTRHTWDACSEPLSVNFECCGYNLA